jgi:hypothetical protein
MDRSSSGSGLDRITAVNAAVNVSPGVWFEDAVEFP